MNITEAKDMSEKAKDWLIENSYPEFMNMTRDNLEIIIDRFSDQQLEALKERCLKILEDHLNSIDPETGDDYRCGVANSINLLCDL